MLSENLKKQSRAIVYAAVKRGDLVRPTVCELCGIDSSQSRQSPEGSLSRLFSDFFGIDESTDIMAHHWKGYQYPLDVWWICRGCNSRLVGEHFHNGSLTKEHVSDMIRNRSINHIRHYNDASGRGATKAMRAAFGEKE